MPRNFCRRWPAKKGGTVADTLCLVPGCNAPCPTGGPRFVRLLCERHREQIPPGVYVALAMQDCLIDALAERAEALNEFGFEVEPEAMVKHLDGTRDRRLFLGVNFGDRLLVKTIEAQIPNE